MKSHKLAAIFLVVFAVAAQAAASTYVITGEDGEFSATKDGGAFGTANQPIQTVIDSIGTDAAGDAATIKFGAGDTLDIGNSTIVFDAIKPDSTQTIRWGAITLEGKITAASLYTIQVRQKFTNQSPTNLSITINTAEIANTGIAASDYSCGSETCTDSAMSGTAILNYGSTLTITGGKVSATTPSGTYSGSDGGKAIQGGTVTISGGEVSATGKSSVAIQDGTVKISGGEVSATGESSVAIKDGSVTASGGGIEATGTDSYATHGSRVTLTGTPEITGTINVSTSVEVKYPTSSFDPKSNTYNIEFSDIQDNVAVRNGAEFVSSFIFASTLNDITLNFSAQDDDITVTTSNGYAVSKSETTYTITKGTGEYIAAQQAIDNIQTQAKGTAPTIQFGDGGVLNIGNKDLSFGSSYDDDGNEVLWSGAITLNGKISANSIILNNVSATSTADITARIENNSGSTLNISGGTIEGYINNYGYKEYSNGGTVVTERIGTLDISAGTINGQVSNNDGILNISGGTINGLVYSYHRDIETSKTTVSGTAKIIATGDAIRIYGDNSWTGEAFKMTDGTVVAGGGYAVHKSDDFNGTASITDGTLFAYKKDSLSTEESVASGVTPDANVTMLAWDKPGSDTTYIAYDTTDIFKSAGTANWLIKDGAKGIAYANGANTGFIELDVAVNKATPAITWPTAAAITYGSPLSSSALTRSDSSGVAGTFAWANPAIKPNASDTAKYDVNFSPTDSVNYTAPSHAIAIVVNKADGLTATDPRPLMISSTDTTEKIFNLADIILNKDDYGTLTYELDTLTNANGILNDTLSIADSTLSYKGTGKTSGTATQKIKITSTNYTDVDVTITFNATDKTEVTIAGKAVNSIYNAGTANAGADSVTANVVDGGVYNDTLVWEYAGTGISSTSTTPPINAGEYELTVSVPDDNETYFGYAIFKFTIAKAAGAAVAAPTLAAKTSTSITVSAVTVPDGQPVEYAKNTTGTEPTDGWQTSPIFTGLTASTTYYIFARAAADSNHHVGAVSDSLSVTTDDSTSSTPSNPGTGNGGGSNPGTGNGGGYVTPILSQIEIGNAAKQIAGGLNLSVKSGATMAIYGLKGNLIQKQSYAKGEYFVSLNSLPKGMYVVKISFGESDVKVLKIAK